jgi:hypothetical protein
MFVFVRNTLLEITVAPNSTEFNSNKPRRRNQRPQALHVRWQKCERREKNNNREWFQNPLMIIFCPSEINSLKHLGLAKRLVNTYICAYNKLPRSRYNARVVVRMYASAFFWIYLDAICYSWRCKLLQRWHCNWRSSDWIQDSLRFFKNNCTYSQPF